MKLSSIELVLADLDEVLKEAEETGVPLSTQPHDHGAFIQLPLRGADMNDILQNVLPLTTTAHKPPYRIGRFAPNVLYLGTPHYHTYKTREWKADKPDEWKNAARDATIAIRNSVPVTLQLGNSSARRSTLFFRQGDGGILCSYMNIHPRHDYLFTWYENAKPSKLYGAINKTHAIWVP